MCITVTLDDLFIYLGIYFSHQHNMPPPASKSAVCLHILSLTFVINF